MSDEYENKTGYQAQSSETLSLSYTIDNQIYGSDSIKLEGFEKRDH